MVYSEQLICVNSDLHPNYTRYVDRFPQKNPCGGGFSFVRFTLFEETGRDRFKKKTVRTSETAQVLDL